MTAVGILGGTFDPVHRGHLLLAASVRRALALERVALLPCAVPPHKPGRPTAARFHRLEMLYLAVEGRAGLGVSTYEIARGGVHFTIDTLRALRAGAAGVSPVFIVGSDALGEITSWKDHQALLEEFDFAAVVRPAVSGTAGPEGWPEVVTRRVSPAVRREAHPPPGAGGRVFVVEVEALPISSSDVRDRCAGGMPLVDLVPAPVARYIQRHRLYREEAPR